MAKCPLCRATVSDDFGLIECGKCGAPLLVHMDGRVEHSGEQQPEKDLTEISSATAADFIVPSPEVEIEIPADTQEPTVVSTEDESEASFHFATGAEAEYKVEPPPNDPASPDLSDIARFGNSDASVHEGSLRYRIYISGIDTADVRESFREAITDRKMMWDVDEILRSIKNGEVEVQNMSSVKAYILVSRLRALPVQVRWEQYASVQA